MLKCQKSLCLFSARNVNYIELVKHYEEFNWSPMFNAKVFIVSSAILVAKKKIK